MPTTADFVSSMSRMKNVPIIDSVGLELESETVRAGDLDIDGFYQEHDASIESVVKVEPNLNVYFDSTSTIPSGMRTEEKIVGVEFVSRIIDTTNNAYENKIRSLTSILREAGEPPQSFRASLHVHVCVPHRLVILKNLLVLGRRFERMMFHIGGMGYEFRGKINSSLYCRPITGKGPVCVPTRKGYKSQCFVLDDCLEATSVEDFWRKHGDINPSNPPNKYWPSRYVWLSLFPINTKGTIEFRQFNKTLNPLYIISAIKLCQAFSELSLNTKLMYAYSGIEEEQSIFKPYTIQDVYNDLDYFRELTELDERTYTILKLIIKGTPTVKIDDTYINSHLEQRGQISRLFGDNYCPPEINESLIVNPDVTDRHNSRYGGH